jgi:menaquinone-9 beta-reductase
VRRAAALIVGGGPAGSAAAIALARGGLRPELIERSEGPRDTVCGGFLGWDALAALRRLGVEAEAIGARPISRLRLVSRHRTVETKLPYPAAGLSRRALDEALVGGAAAAGALLARGRSVRSAEPGRIRLDDGEEIAANALILATGKHELRGLARPVDGSLRPVGLRTALRGSARLAHDLEGVVELHLYDGGYAGLLLQEDGTANLCLSASRGRLKEAGGIDQVVRRLAEEMPSLAGRLGEERIAEWSAVSGIPYGWRAVETGSGVYRVGDQAAVIASLAGDGIAIALESGIAAAKALLRGENAPDFQRRWAARSARPLAVGEALRNAAEHAVPRDALMGLIAWFPSLAPIAARLTRIGRP